MFALIKSRIQKLSSKLAQQISLQWYSLDLAYLSVIIDSQLKIDALEFLYFSNGCTRHLQINNSD